jgi:hypothetical protein
MNSSNKEHGRTNQATQTFDPPLIHEEELLHPRPDDDETADKNKPAEEEEDKEKTEVITKEAMLRVTGGQL